MTITQLNLALACPRIPSYPRYPKGAYRLLSECWVTVLYQYLADTSAVDMLVDAQDATHSIYLTPDDCIVYGQAPSNANQPFNEMALDLLTTNEIAEAVRILEGSRFDFAMKSHSQFSPRTQHDIFAGELLPPEPKSLSAVWLDRHFNELTDWIWDLGVVEANVREKHWLPANVKTQSELRKFSKTQKGIGWLNPGTQPDDLRSFGLAVLTEHFRRTLDERTKSTFIKERVDTFLEVMKEISRNGTFRLGITHRVSMGMYNGTECVRMVYDFDPSAKQIHCFPVLEFPSIQEEFRESQLEL